MVEKTVRNNCFSKYKSQIHSSEWCHINTLSAKSATENNKIFNLILYLHQNWVLMIFVYVLILCIYR